MSHLKKEMPSMFGKDTKKKELMTGLADIFASLQRQHQISAGDFPSIQRMQEQLQYHDFSKFPQLKPKLLETVDRMLADDIARLMTRIPKEEEQRTDAAVVKVVCHCVYHYISDPLLCLVILQPLASFIL